MKGDVDYWTPSSSALHKELRTVGVLPTVGHRQQEGFVVLHGKLLVWKGEGVAGTGSVAVPENEYRLICTVKGAAVNGLSPRAVVVGEIPGLDHKVLDDPVKNYTFVV